MPIARSIRLLAVVILLVLALIWVWRTKLDPTRVALFITAVIGGVTTIYALVTYEILLQNQTMAKATSDSTALMERSLRFSHAPNLLYSTVNTTDPTFSTNSEPVTPIDNDDYKRALAAFKASGERKEFVFAMVKNKGRGAATNLSIEALYDITDSSNPNRESTVKKEASVQILDPGKAVALCVFISKVPTAGDKVALASAHLTTSDFYRDAINEPAQSFEIDAKKHHIEVEAGSVVRVV